MSLKPAMVPPVIRRRVSADSPAITALEYCRDGVVGSGSAENWAPVREFGECQPTGRELPVRRVPASGVSGAPAIGAGGGAPKPGSVPGSVGSGRAFFRSVGSTGPVTVRAFPRSSDCRR